MTLSEYNERKNQINDMIESELIEHAQEYGANWFMANTFSEINEARNEELTPSEFETRVNVLFTSMADNYKTFLLKQAEKEYDAQQEAIDTLAAFDEESAQDEYYEWKRAGGMH